MTIRSKILWILAVPFLGFLVLVVLKVVDDGRRWQEAQALVRTAATQSLTSVLIHELQLERGMSAGFLGSRGGQFAQELRAQRLRTDAAHDALDRDGGRDTSNLDEALPALRKKIDQFQATAAESLAFYTGAIRTYLDALAASSQGLQQVDLARSATGYYFFLTAKEAVGQLRAGLNGVLVAGRFDPASTKRVQTVLANLETANADFQRFSTPADFEAVQALLADPAVARADQAVAAVLASAPEGSFPFDAPTVFAALTGKIEVMKRADDALGALLQGRARATADEAALSVSVDGSVALVLVLLALVLAFRLTRSIRVQLGCEPSEVASVARNIARGILDLPPAKKTSLGAYHDLGLMVGALRGKAEALERVAAGDLVLTQAAAPEDRLGTTLDATVAQLRTMIEQIRSAVDQLTSGASQVATASQALAQGATEQAAAVEQINASATEVAGQAQKNAQTAQSAAEAARVALAAATEGSTRMQNLLDLVHEMSEASAATQRIVKTIDDIAFQVNLLALNANVEAARAGKYGKGFGVVAEEVRSLALRSATAVGETSALVNRILVAIRAVDDTARKTGESLEAISGGTTQVASILEHIATSSHDQARALGEVRQGLDQIDGVTQSNTASAEQSASAAEQLSGQAVELKGQVARFRLE